MRDRRQFVRFKVTEVKELKANIDRYRKSEQIVTISEGGCGFYGFNDAWPLAPVKRVFCSFSLDGVIDEPVEIQANVVYIRPISVDGREVIYYGVEFLESQRGVVAPIISKLEEMNSEGKVSISE